MRLLTLSLFVANVALMTIADPVSAIVTARHHQWRLGARPDYPGWG
jgi:hypothetical protein